MQDHRTLPRVEMELVLTGKKIEFSPSCAEVAKHTKKKPDCRAIYVVSETFHQTPVQLLKVADMIISVVHEMNKLLREVNYFYNNNKNHKSKLS